MALNTRDRILDAFFELADKQPDRPRFTFTEIAKEAGLSRQAIYKRHFNNTTEIIEYIRQDMVKQAFAPNWNSNNSEADLDPFTFLAQTILPAIYEQRQRIKILYTSSVDPLWSDFITASYKDWIEQNLNLDHQKLGIPEDLANQLLAGWISSLIENWITQDDPVPCKQFSKTFLNLVSSPLTSFAAYDSPAGSSNKIVIA
ncbi:TetR/AcrR family transcriptional regulator [Streptococcus sanguinis]|uniref:TetR/AcrR family transcriptional regulator n=1 Tax=Streptococcus sanguinis TaxID=1305 RepID=UPI000F6631A8|nr:TetR/AcrR family transcriptional regulator [Streptococcus sanguinis]RSI29432.1 DNA-binding transcriptional repressor AcrR [Streptococcus sanguinis]